MFMTLTKEDASIVAELPRLQSFAEQLTELAKLVRQREPGK
jgi:hypothetical protein